MFLFSESSGNPDFEANERFDTDYDSRAYESKVAKLLGRSCARDRKTEDGKASWKDALKALSKEDFYGLVMIDQAKIPRIMVLLRFCSKYYLCVHGIGLFGLGLFWFFSLPDKVYICRTGSDCFCCFCFSGSFGT